MAARSRSLQARLFPHGWVDVLRQIALFSAAYFAYRLVRGGVDGRAAAAFQHARDVINFERGVHIFVEPTVQAWASGSQVVVDAASWIYLNAQTTTMIAALLWLYVQRNSSFYFVRNMMIVSMAIALVGYIVFPTAPPRMLPEWGFADTVADLTGVHTDSVTANARFNPYAAIPSMHLAMALMIGWPLAKLVRNRPGQIFWRLYPVLVTFVIVATANHFLADAFFGACTAAVAAYAAAWLARARPAVWTFSRVGGDGLPA
jgi:hypothetical protein